MPPSSHKFPQSNPHFSQLLQKQINYLLLLPGIFDALWRLGLLFAVLLVVELESHAILEDYFFFEGVVGTEFRSIYQEVVLLVRDIQMKQHFDHFGGVIIFTSRILIDPWLPILLLVPFLHIHGTNLQPAQCILLRNRGTREALECQISACLDIIQLLSRADNWTINSKRWNNRILNPVLRSTENQ